MASKGTEIVEAGDVGTLPAVRDAATMATMDDDSRKLLEAYFAEVAPVEVEDPSTVELRIIAETLASESFEDLFAPRELVAWTDHPGVAFMVEGVRWNASKYDQQEGVYCVVSAVEVTNETRALLHTGSRRCMAQLYVAAQRGWLPAVLKIVAGTETQRGFTPYHLESARG